MRGSKTTRRRVLRIIAASGAACLPFTRSRAATELEWRGTALGADARILLASDDTAAAEGAIAACLAEIARLERIFSLHMHASDLVRLNADGVLLAPPRDLVEVLSLSRRISSATGGLFDPTVQPLWRLYAEWYAGRPHREPPPPDELDRRMARVGIGRVQCTAGRISLARGAALTFNGIAQGYITDRVADVLRARGWSHVLLDIGEVRALDGRADGSPFDVAIGDGGLRIELADRALATSAPDGLVFAAGQDLGHILDPATGRSLRRWRAVTVQHAAAAVADGLSTALVLADGDRIARIVAAVPGTKVWATSLDGVTRTFGA